jgi:hypothetical protein
MSRARVSSSYDIDEYMELFLSNDTVRDMLEIERISDTENQYLYPYFIRFKEQMKAYKKGIFIMDARSIYTPIEPGFFGVVHVERLPTVKPRIYGLTDLMNCGIFLDDKRAIIFVGIFKTAEYGYKFIHEGFQVKPITGLSFSNPIMMVTKDETITQTEPAEIEDDEGEIIN